jgi:type IV secretion system protein VirD4
VPPARAPGNEFEVEDDAAAKAAAKAAARRRHIRRSMKGNARNASLDPDDGIDL